MNVCFLGKFNAGGTERATFIVANELCKKHKVFIVNTCNLEPSFELNSDIKFDYLKQGNIINKNIQIAKYLRKNQIDILVSVEAMVGVLTVVASKLVRCKHIIWEHANYYQNQGVKYINLVRQIELKVVDAYIVLTKRDLNNFKMHFKVKTKLIYIYNICEYVNTNKYNINSKVIISAGHIRTIKNFISIPDIAKNVFEKHPDWCWKIYGEETGNQYKELLQKIKSFNLEDKILLCGRSYNMNRVYSEAAFYVMTSLQEGLPMVLLEAKANRLPLISFDIETGPSEIIDDGVNGYLVPPYDIDVMEERITNLIENKALRKSMSDMSKNDLNKFDKKNIIDKWETLLKEI